MKHVISSKLKRSSWFSFILGGFNPQQPRWAAACEGRLIRNPATLHWAVMKDHIEVVGRVLAIVKTKVDKDVAQSKENRK